jgi:hypothetical protein
LKISDPEPAKLSNADAENSSAPKNKTEPMTSSEPTRGKITREELDGMFGFR